MAAIDQALRRIRQLRPSITDSVALCHVSDLETTDPRWIWQQLLVRSSPEIGDFFFPKKRASSKIGEILSKAAADFSTPSDVPACN